MPITHVESAVPYDESRVWKLQDAYFDARGLDAWTEGDIPYGATSNPVIARQHVAWIGKVLPADERVVVLEIGSGNGAFAKYFLRAANERSGKAVGKRLVYVISDVWAENLRRLVKEPFFAYFVERGQLVAATYDVRTPERLLGLDGQPLDLRPNVIIANYVACVTPTKVLHKSPLGWLERYVRLGFEATEPVSPEDAWARLQQEAGAKDGGKRLETSWMPCDPVDTLGPVNGAAARDVLSGLREGTVAVPYAFLDLVGRLVDEWQAHALVADFGRPDADEMQGQHLRDPVMYGGCMSHALDFPVFDHWGHHRRIDVLRTVDPLRMVHVVAMRPMKDDQRPFVKAFRSVYDNRDAEGFFDLMHSSRDAFDDKDWPRAARMASEAMKVDPLAVELYHRFGNALVNLGFGKYAVYTLRKGRRIQGPDGPYDFDLALGRAYMEAKDYDAARKALRASLRREESAITLVDLARLAERTGDAKGQAKFMARAEALAPGDAYITAWNVYFEDKRKPSLK